MESNNVNQKKHNCTSTLTRRHFLRWSGAAAGGAVLAGNSISRAFAGPAKTLTIGNIGWDEDVALSHLTKVVLEEHFDYHVNIVSKTVDGLFSGVANGSIDTFQDVWLPTTHQPEWNKYGNEVVRLPPWYEGRATLGLTVPDYVQAQSIGDLSVYDSRFHHRIVGIEPGAGEMRIIKNKVMPAYNLNNYKLTSGSTQSMLKQLGQAINQHQPIVVALYRPHWAFNVYNLRYLKDPKGAISNLHDRLYTITRKGLKKDKPEAYAFLDAINLTPSQLGQLELAIQGADNPNQGVRNWLSGNRAFGANTSVNKQMIQPWIEAAQNAAVS